jgi:hypothetical protein
MKLTVEKSTASCLSTRRKLITTAVLMSLASNAMAFEFEVDGGWKGVLNTTLTASSGWRAESPDKSIINATNARQSGLSTAASSAAATAEGYHGGATDDYNLNYRKGDQYSELYKFVSDLNLSKDGTGGMIRVKGWYDRQLNNGDVYWGNQSSGYSANKPLSDRDMGAFNKFDGLELLDAYVYTSFDLADRPVQLRLGRQAVNWGESVFIKGANEMSRLDVAALRKAGTELKEALLPVWSLYGNMSLGDGMSVEAYYQFKHEAHNIDECGTYWAPLNGSFSQSNNACAAAFIAGGNRFGYSNGWYLGGTGAPESKLTKDGGEYGFAFRLPVEAIDTEFAFYAMNTHAKAPVINLVVGSDLRAYVAPALIPASAGGPRPLGTVLPAGLLAALKPALLAVPMTPISNVGSLLAARSPLFAGTNGLGARIDAARAAGTLQDSSAYWVYPEDIQTYAISATTTLAGWSVASELSHQRGVPVMMNAPDLIAGIVNGQGPLSAVGSATGVAGNGLFASGTTLGTLTPRVGETIEGWKRVNKTQFQVNGLVTLPAILGASNGLFVAEAGAQWTDLPSSYRFNRAFLFGVGTHPTVTTGAATDNTTCTNVGKVEGTQDTGCRNEGYSSDFSWGYRLKASLDYPQFMGTNWVATPSLFIGHDVKGYSIDGQFNQGRLAVSYGLGFNLNKEHKIDLAYTTYSNSAEYDIFRDHDNYSIAYSYTF